MKRKNRTKKEPTGTERAVWAIRDAAWTAISQHFGDSLGFGATDWRRRNVAGARTLFDAGHSPEAVVQMLERAWAHPFAGYNGCSSLEKLASWWAQISAVSGPNNFGYARRGASMSPELKEQLGRMVVGGETNPPLAPQPSPDRSPDPLRPPPELVAQVDQSVRRAALPDALRSRLSGASEAVDEPPEARATA